MNIKLLMAIAVIAWLCPQWTQAQDCIQTSVSYDHADWFVDGLARVQRDGKWGFINKSGKEVVPCVWDGIYYYYDGLALVEQNEKYGFINMNNEIIVPIEYDGALDFSDGVGAVCKYTDEDELWAIIDDSGKFVTSFIYSDVARDVSGTHVYIDHEDENGMFSQESYMIDKYGNRVDETSEDKEDLEIVKRDGKSGVVNKKNKTVIPFEYDMIQPMIGGYYIVTNARLNGLFSKDGKQIIPCKYLEIFPFHEGIAKVYDGNVKKYGFINDQGVIISECKFSAAKSFSDGYAVVTDNNKMGYINSSGELVIPCVYETAESFYDEWANVDNKYFIDKQGNRVLSYQGNPYQMNLVSEFDNITNSQWNENESMWKSVYINSKSNDGIRIRVADLDMTKDFFEVDFSDEGLAVVVKDDKYGFVNTRGELVIPFIYDDAHRFSEGLAAVQSDFKWGFINTRGELVTPMTNYLNVEDFSEGMAAVENGDFEWGFINTRGELVIPMIYDWAESFSDGLAAVEKDGRWGFVDNSGNLVFPCKYDSMYFPGDDREEDFDIYFDMGQVFVGPIAPSEGWIDDADGIYNYISNFHEGKAFFVKETVNKNKKSFEKRYIDKSGKTVIILNGYNNAGDFYEGFARVTKKLGNDLKYGFIDKSGNELIHCVYDFAFNFHEGLAGVSRIINGDYKFGYIDKTGKEVIPCIFDRISDFKNGLALVETHVYSDAAKETVLEWKYIDKTGEIIKVVRTVKNKKRSMDEIISDLHEENLKMAREKAKSE